MTYKDTKNVSEHHTDTHTEQGLAQPYRQRTIIQLLAKHTVLTHTILTRGQYGGVLTPTIFLGVSTLKIANNSLSAYYKTTRTNPLTLVQ